MKRLAPLLLIAALVSGCTQPSSSVNQGFVSADGAAVLRDASERGTAVELAAAQLDGKSTWQLSGARGQVVVLNSWGPWCGPCRTEAPQLQRLANDFAAKGLVVVGLATRTNAAAVTAFTRKAQITYLQLADYDSSAIASIAGVPSMTIPGSLLIDRKGRVAGWVLGASDPGLLRSLVESLLEESK